MINKNYNGFKSERQYEAVKNEVINCMANSDYEYDYYFETIKVTYDADRESIDVYLDDFDVFLIGPYDNLCLYWSNKKRRSIQFEEIDIISKLNDFDWNCMNVEESEVTLS